MQRQGDQKFKNVLGYILSLKSVWAAQTLSQNRKEEEVILKFSASFQRNLNCFVYCNSLMKLH